MKKLLEITAIKMIPPKPYGMFHITFFVLSIVLSCILANKLKDVSDRKNKKILFFTGLFLLVIEVYKELFYYFVVNNGSYDFSIFPFQLCDVPMYICLIIPFIKNKKIGIILGTIIGFTLMLWITIQFIILPLNILSITYFIIGLIQLLTSYMTYDNKKI